MSLHKYASNVIEKALNFGSDQQREEIISEIINKDDVVVDSLLNMVKDKYGNYVVQKMIEYSDQSTKENIIKRIVSSQSLRKREGFSKHVINFIEKMGFNVGQFKLQIQQNQSKTNMNKNIIPPQNDGSGMDAKNMNMNMNNFNMNMNMNMQGMIDEDYEGDDDFGDDFDNNEGGQMN